MGLAGGKVKCSWLKDSVHLDVVLPHMNVGGRIVVCGQTADYSAPHEERHGIRNTNPRTTRRRAARRSSSCARWRAA